METWKSRFDSLYEEMRLDYSVGISFNPEKIKSFIRAEIAAAKKQAYEECLRVAPEYIEDELTHCEYVKCSIDGRNFTIGEYKKAIKKLGEGL